MGGKNRGLISNNALQRINKIRFYNKFCDNEVVSYKINFGINGCVISYSGYSNILSNDLISCFNRLEKRTMIILLVKVKEIDGLIVEQLIQLKVF